MGHSVTLLVLTSITSITSITSTTSITSGSGRDAVFLGQGGQLLQELPVQDDGEDPGLVLGLHEGAGGQRGGRRPTRS